MWEKKKREAIKKKYPKKDKTLAGEFQIFHAAIFSPIRPIEQGIYSRINKWDYVELKGFLTDTENISKMKREPTL